MSKGTNGLTKTRTYFLPPREPPPLRVPPPPDDGGGALCGVDGRERGATCRGGVELLPPPFPGALLGATDRVGVREREDPPTLSLPPDDLPRVPLFTLVPVLPVLVDEPGATDGRDEVRVFPTRSLPRPCTAVGRTIPPLFSVPLVVPE